MPNNTTQCVCVGWEGWDGDGEGGGSSDSSNSQVFFSSPPVCSLLFPRSERSAKLYIFFCASFAEIQSKTRYPP